MKKAISIFIVILFYIFIANNVYAYDVKEEYMIDPYDIKDHSELVNLYDELRGVYQRTCEDASLYEEKIAELESDLKEEQKIALENNTTIKVIILVGIVIIVAVIYFSNK